MAKYIVHYFDDKGNRVGNLTFDNPASVVDLIQLLSARNPDGGAVNVKFGGGEFVFARMEAEIDGDTVFVRFAFQSAAEAKQAEEAASAERANMLAQLQGRMGPLGTGQDNGPLPGQEFDFGSLGIPLEGEDEDDDE